ncbi:hypothetical protein BCT30_05825 [Enterovibrio norvegicus]|nr:hypothetical protein BCU47_16700 [Enterovibrio norvegicus]PMI35612.1 hypothetical protein BCU46_17820 [Enterovibrio norvegicus]PMN43841.1 hypothetical protein BCT30_05825 [Enterovibrio norvegicus]
MIIDLLWLTLLWMWIKEQGNREIQLCIAIADKYDPLLTTSYRSIELEINGVDATFCVNSRRGGFPFGQRIFRINS